MIVREIYHLDLIYSDSVDFIVKLKENIVMLCVLTWKVNFTTVHEAKASSTSVAQQLLSSLEKPLCQLFTARV